MFDYKKIDISADGDMEKDVQLEHLVAKLAGFPDDANKDALAIFKEWVLDAQLEQCARTNNAQRAQELIEKTTPQEVTECLMQAAARGHIEVLEVFAQHTRECEDRFYGLAAAAYFNHKDCVELMLPYFLSSADRWMVQKGVDAAIEGSNFKLAHILMPHIDITGMYSAAFRFAVRDGKQEVAELFYPYSDIADMLQYVKRDEEPETIDQIVQWIEEYESKKLAQRINNEVGDDAVKIRNTFKKM